jgi:UDP-GlcNAc3NAcA epimerase
VHPRTRYALERSAIDTAPLRVCEPLGYLEMAQLLAHCAVVFTDSGGLQKEAYFHGKRCVTLRDETEWVETIACGWNRLWRVPEYADLRPIPEYGDGNSASRIVALLEQPAVRSVRP